jgi:hypothetical protein
MTIATATEVIPFQIDADGVARGGCPRIVIFSQIEECEKNYRRYMVDIPRIIF